MRWRLLASYVTLTAFVVIALGVPLAVAFQHDRQHDRTIQVERGATTLATLADDSLEHHVSVSLPLLAERYAHQLDARVVIIDSQGQTLADAGGGGSLAWSRSAVTRSLSGSVVAGDAPHSRLFVSAPVTGRGAVLVIYPDTGVDAEVRSYWLRIAGFGLASVVLAALAGYFLARGIVRPLDDLERAAAAAGAGDLTARAAERGPRETRSLARSFNDSAAQLERLMASQQAFVADASHELRTPLAALRLRLENLQSAVPADEDDLAGAIAEVDRLSTLVDGLLALARLEGTALERCAVDIGAVVESRASLWDALSAEHGVTVGCEVSGWPLAWTSPGRLEQVLDNLLSNSLDASADGGAIELRAASKDGCAELHVIDHGRGLQTAERERAFDRFWRGSVNHSGSGLGLAIVRRLVEADHGQVELRETPGGGIDAVVRLPEAPPDKNPPRP